MNWITVTGLLLIAVAGSAAAPPDFYVYHTRLDYDIPVGNGAVTDKYADIVVNVATGQQLVFSRETSYLPYLKTSKGKFPLRALVDCKPDPLCLCSYARVITNEPGRIVIHWRHVPDPASRVTSQVIHELFTITPGGHVTRTVRAGTPRLDDFTDSANVAVQLKLTADGVTEVSLTKAAPTDSPSAPNNGAAVRENNIGAPVGWLKFDDGHRAGRDETTESVTGKRYPVAGHRTLWKQGVSGTALAFDGYTSKVAIPRAKVPAIEGELTLEAWVVLGAYPWHDAGIVHQSQGETDKGRYRPWEMAGYFLGIGPYGSPVFKVNGEQAGGIGRKGKALPTYRWLHLAGTYGKGRMALYVDGELVDSLKIEGEITIPDRDLLIGLNGDAQRGTDPVRGPNNHLPVTYGIEGLIDEVRVHNKALSAAQIKQSYDALHPGARAVIHPDLQRRILPGEVDGKPAARFGATYKTLKYHELWDNLWRPSDYRDIVVRFDTVPGAVTFWQGVNFGAGWVTENNKWMADQSCEIGGPHGCAEHMADKQARFGHVRLIENTDARVVVHWRYPSIDVGYKFRNPRVWSDEIHTIYPDGVGIRKVKFHAGNPGWQDIQFLSQPGTTCLDNMNLQALSVATLDGKTADLTWAPPNNIPKNPLPKACIELINFKSKTKVFAIFQEGTYMNPWGHREQSRHTADPFAGPWNHWPVGLLPSDGRFAVANDRVTHAAIAAADNVVHHGNMAMYGLTDQPIDTLVPLARSWNRPAEVGDVRGGTSSGYNKDQRAYEFAATAPKLAFKIEASEQRPVVNPCLVIRDWMGGAKAAINVDGKAIGPGKHFRQGLVRDIDGKPMMILWLEMNKTATTTIAVSSPD